jgi:predicted GIY-YIG superfamily endonuclease
MLALFCEPKTSRLSFFLFSCSKTQRLVIPSLRSGQALSGARGTRAQRRTCCCLLNGGRVPRAIIRSAKRKSRSFAPAGLRMTCSLFFCEPKTSRLSSFLFSCSKTQRLVILSGARGTRGAKDLLLVEPCTRNASDGTDLTQQKQVLRACGAQDDMLALFAGQEEREKRKRGARGERKEKTQRLVILSHFEEFLDVRDAIAREKEIKGWMRYRKIRLVEGRNPTWEDLARGWFLGT